jgi:hypothetical protein
MFVLLTQHSVCDTVHSIVEEKAEVHHHRYLSKVLVEQNIVDADEAC